MRLASPSDDIGIIAGETMKRKHTVEITMDDTALYLLRKFVNKRITTKPETLVSLAVARVVSEAAQILVDEANDCACGLASEAVSNE